MKHTTSTRRHYQYAIMDQLWAWLKIENITDAEKKALRDSYNESSKLAIQ